MRAQESITHDTLHTTAGTNMNGQGIPTHQLIDHVDNMGSAIARSLAIASVVSGELLNSTRTVQDELLARLVWQIEENLKAMDGMLRLLCDQGRAKSQADRLTC